MLHKENIVEKAIEKLYLQGTTDGFFEVVDGNEIGEKRQNVLDLDEVALFQELHRLLNVVLFVDNVLSCQRKEEHEAFTGSGRNKEQIYY